MMRGIEINNAIADRKKPDFIHTMWDISHIQPDFDITGRNESYEEANPCGKADILQDLWRKDLERQLKSNTHMTLTLCKQPNEDEDIEDLPELAVGFAIFDDEDNEAKMEDGVYAHIFVDKEDKRLGFE